MAERAGGVIVRTGNEAGLRFLPAGIATRVVRRPTVSHVPGADIGMALIDGRVVPVIQVGATSEDLLLCDVHGEQVAISGLAVLEAGLFECRDGDVTYGGERVAPFDVAQLVRATVATRPVGHP